MADLHELPDAPVCPACGAQWGVIGPGTRVHFQRLVCGQCGRWLRWLPHSKETVMTDRLTPPSAPMMTDPPPSLLDPPDDIPEPTVPPATLAALSEAPPPAAPEASTPLAFPSLPDTLRPFEPLMQGFLQVTQRHLRGQMDEYASDLKSRLGAIDLEHLRLCATLEQVAKLAQQAVTNAAQQNEHAAYQLSHALLQLQEHGVQLRTAPYTVQVQSSTPEGYAVTFTATKEDPETLLAAVQALVAWLAQQGYQGVTTGVA